MPAAAVIPAPIAYIKVVAVKTLVVGYLPAQGAPPKGCVAICVLASSWGVYLHLIVRGMSQGIYFEEMRVLQAGDCHEYVSME